MTSTMVADVRLPLEWHDELLLITKLWKTNKVVLDKPC